ncbi:AAA family ATPase, partial [Clostridioides difficile]
FDLIIVDTVADTFPDNENDRYKVNLFIKGALAKLAQETGAAILVLAHPSKSSMQGKDLSSGSTAWDGAVRQKLGMRKNEDGVT